MTDTSISVKPGALVAETKRPRFSRHRVRAGLTALGFLLPVLVPLVLFAYYPIIQGLMYAFQKVNLIDASTWVGLDNFRRIFDDPAFGKAWRNTITYAVVIVMFANVVPLLISVMVHEVRWARSFFQLAIYLPVMTPPLVVALLWKWVYDPSTGLANTLLGAVGIGRQGFLSSPSQALLSISVIAIWSSWGFAALIYLAALGAIPSELYEAAEIDGATAVERFRFVTVPEVKPQLMVLTLLGLLSCLQFFSLPFVLTDGGPVNSTVSVAQLIYVYAFRMGDLGAASALALLLMAFLAAVSAVYNWLVNRVSR